MPTKSYLSFFGFLLLIVATYCPLLSFTWMKFDIYDLNQPFGLVLLFMAVIGILSVFLKQKALTKIASWSSLILVALLIVAVYVKIRLSFGMHLGRSGNWVGFIYSGTFFSKFLASAAQFVISKIKFKWGWYLLFAGPILAIVGNATTKSGISASGAKLK